MATVVAAAMPGWAGETRTVDVRVDAAHVLRTMEPRRLGGTNVALWYFPATYEAALPWMSELNAQYIRIPGGSWANGIFWNGHGVRGPDGRVDPTRVGPDGYPAVDYSGYAPSFRVNEKTLHPEAGDWHGHVDVKTQHEFIRAIPGAEAMVCPNAGTGRAVDAAEWVRWANHTMGYGVRVWEIGNELGGSWEAGTQMPLGKGLITGDIYSARYIEMARAMRAVDPTIRIGTCPFPEEVLRDAGDLVDFVSHHTYPGSRTMSEASMLAGLPAHVKREVDHLKGLIRRYQPQREGQIEICYSEWNLGGGVDNARMFTALWSSVFLGEIARNDVAMAMQWDAFSDLFAGPDDGYARKAQFYALSLWNNYMQPRLVSAESSDATVFTYASASDDAVVVMLVNADAEREAEVAVSVSGFVAAAEGELALLTSREYSYDAAARRVRWSLGPRVQRAAVGQDFTVTVPPYAVAYVRVPAVGAEAVSAYGAKAMARSAGQAADRPPRPAELRLSLPGEVYAGDEVYAELLAVEAGGGELRPYGGVMGPATLTASGVGAVLDRGEVRLAEAVGHFRFRAMEPGKLVLTARSGELSVTREVEVKPSVPRPVVLWDFSSPPLTDGSVFESDFVLVEDLTQRANRAVARVDLSERRAVGDSGNGLLKINQLPPAERLNRANIRGVVADVRTSADFACADPDAHVMVVMQSTANWWMVIGRIPLKDAAEWTTHELLTTNEEHFQAMPAALNVIFVLQANAPATGSVYLDRIGLMVR